MGPSPNLIYYASVAKGTVTIAEYSRASIELSDAASNCLGKIPPLHSRFSHTAKRRLFNCLINDSWIYCAIVDEALGKSNAYSYLEQVRDEFLKFLGARGLPLNGEGLGTRSLDTDFTPVLCHLAAPFVGIPQKEKDRMEEELRARQEVEVDLAVTSPSAMAPLPDTNDQEFLRRTEKKSSDRRSPFRSIKGKGHRLDKRKVKDQVKEVKEVTMENNGEAMDRGQKLEIIVTGSTPATAGTQVPKSPSRSRAQESARRMWWKRVRLVLILDTAVCLILFAIWLGICKGISCIK